MNGVSMTTEDTLDMIVLDVGAVLYGFFLFSLSR
jgi:hypothetical protein